MSEYSKSLGQQDAQKNLQPRDVQNEDAKVRQDYNAAFFAEQKRKQQQGN